MVPPPPSNVKYLTRFFHNGSNGRADWKKGLANLGSGKKIK
jgi:hypothetical protein